MHDGSQASGPLTQPVLQGWWRNDSRDLVLREIAPALVLAQPVADHDLVATVGQRRDQVGADKARTAGYEVHWAGIS
jgi:hypothetical protein